MLYRSVIRPLLFCLDPEIAHRVTLHACAAAARVPLLRSAVRSRCRVAHPSLEQSIAGLRFDNPIGLAAGFDKNGIALEMINALGFGHVEIGSISAHPSGGNPRPRLFRVPDDEAIVVCYGVPSEGASAVADRMTGRDRGALLGINLVKTNDPQRPPTDEEVLDDFSTAFARLHDLASYINLNLSCPNSANDHNYFDDVSKLHMLLSRLAQLQPRVPVFLKLKPSTDPGFLREIVATANPFAFVAGFGINLPSGKPSELQLKSSRTAIEKLPGAVSGRPVELMINANLRLLYEAMGKDSRFKLMAAGGVSSAEDAYRKIRLGASLVQLYTALVYRGPFIVKEILHDLVCLLARDGFENVTKAVGADVH